MKLRLLMFVRDPSWFGGVVNFINLLEDNLSGQILIEKFQIGQRKNQAGRWVRLIAPLTDMVSLASRVTRKHYDVVHVNPSLNGRSLSRDALFMLVIKVRGLKNILVFMHGWDDKTAAIIGRHSVLKWIFISLFGRAPVVYVLANRFRQTLMDWGVDGSRVHVVTTMFDGRQFDGVIRKRDNSEIRLLFLSRFIREKGIYELLAAFSSLRPCYPELRLVLAGDGPEMSSMREWVDEAGLQGSVSFTGYVREKEKAQVLVDADVFVLPSYSEGCPVSLLEAMAAGLPVIATDVGGISNVIAPEENGYLLDGVTQEKIEVAIKKLLDDGDAQARMTAYNKKVAWEYYEASAVTAGIEKAYRRLASQG